MTPFRWMHVIRPANEGVGGISLILITTTLMIHKPLLPRAPILVIHIRLQFRFYTTPGSQERSSDTSVSTVTIFHTPERRYTLEPVSHGTLLTTNTPGTSLTTITTNPNTPGTSLTTITTNTLPATLRVPSRASPRSATTSPALSEEH